MNVLVSNWYKQEPKYKGDGETNCDLIVSRAKYSSLVHLEFTEITEEYIPKRLSIKFSVGQVQQLIYDLNKQISQTDPALPLSIDPARALSIFEG